MLLPAQRAPGSVLTAPGRSVEATWRTGAPRFEVCCVFGPHTSVRLKALAELLRGWAPYSLFSGLEKSPLPAGSVSIESILIASRRLLPVSVSTRTGFELTLSMATRCSHLKLAGIEIEQPLDPKPIQVTSRPSSVPEPSTWAAPLSSAAW